MVAAAERLRRRGWFLFAILAVIQVDNGIFLHLRSVEELADAVNIDAAMDSFLDAVEAELFAEQATLLN